MMDTIVQNLLINISEIDKPSIPTVFKTYRDYIDRVMDWAQEYLCKAHPQLGRKGPVCPFVGKSLEKNLFFLSVYDQADVEIEEVQQLLLAFRDRFLETEPTTGYDTIFKSILVLFPNLDVEKAPEIIDQTQVELIERFTPKKLMIGEFHPGPPQKPGLWNDDFRPLYCPVPMLVIRHMVNTDILFLKRNKPNTVNYLKFFGHDIPQKMKVHVNEAVRAFDLDFPLFEEIEAVAG